MGLNELLELSLGLACLLDTLFGGSKRKYNESYTHNCDPMRETELDDRYDSLSERINELESRLDNIDSDSALYDDLYDDIEILRDLEGSCGIAAALSFIGFPLGSPRNGAYNFRRPDLIA